MKKITNINKYKKKQHQTKSIPISKLDTVKTTPIISNHIRIFMIAIFLLLVALIIRLFFLQFVQGSSLKEMAYNQQTINRLISPKRGNILDSTGKTLATSASVDTVSINPTKIKASAKEAKALNISVEEATKQKKEKLAKAFSEIFELNYDEVLEKVNSTSAVQTIIKKVEKDKIDQLKNWMKENSTSSGINIDEDTKRYYPYNNLASHVIGFCGDDNQGLYGIEQKWDTYLTGTPGKIVTSADVNKDEISDKNQQYIEAENGSDIVLSIDANIQLIAEKYLKQAVEENNCARGGNVIIMNPNTGDILALANYPDYNLNTPFTPTYSVWQQNWESYTSEQKAQMWRNTSVSSTYEPGSTFKLVNAAIALEENITGTDIANDFTCTGAEVVSGQTIKCWTSGAHGRQTLRNVLENSCNPGMIQLGQRIGVSTLYKYYNAFDFFTTSGVDLPGDQKGIFFDQTKILPVELATVSFGQRFNITPLQLIKSIAAIANDGVMMKPRIVKQLINTETNTVTNVEPVEIRQIISKETSEKMRSIMESVVTDGTGTNGSVKGYSVGGKTGTSEPTQNNKNQGYVASFVAIAPVENPELVILAVLYAPQAKDYHGGTVAGPVVSNILTEVLPYLGIPSDKVDVNNKGNNNLITVPNVVNKTVTEAQNALKRAGFRCDFNVSGNKNQILVTDQVPPSGTKLFSNSIIMLYSAENNVRTSTTVPNLTGMTTSQAANSLAAKKLNVSILEGTGKVVSQEPAFGESVEEGTVVKITLKEDEN